MMTGIRVAVVDDHPLFREGVTRSLSEIDGFEVVAEGGSRDEATGFRDTLVFTRTTLSAQPFAMSDHPPRGVQRAISGSQSG